MKPNLNSGVGPRRKKDQRTVLKKAKITRIIENFLRLERDLPRMDRKKTIKNIIERYKGWLKTIAQMKRRINPAIFVTGCRRCRKDSLSR